MIHYHLRITVKRKILKFIKVLKPAVDLWPKIGWTNVSLKVDRWCALTNCVGYILALNVSWNRISGINCITGSFYPAVIYLGWISFLGFTKPCWRMDSQLCPAKYNAQSAHSGMGLAGRVVRPIHQRCSSTRTGGLFVQLY